MAMAELANDANTAKANGDNLLGNWMGRVRYASVTMSLVTINA